MQNPTKNISLVSFAKGLLTFLLVATVIGGYFFFQKDARQQAVARAQENLQSIAYALSVHVDGTLEQADHIGRVMRNNYVAGTNYAANAKAVYAELDTKLYPQLGIIDAKGMSIFGTLPDFKPLDLSDRKHFRVHADGKGEDVLFVSAPVLGRASKKLTLQLTRPINSKDGQFLGVTVVSINPEEFTSVYRKLLLKNGIIALNGFDGINRIRVDRTGFNFGVGHAHGNKKIAFADPPEGRQSIDSVGHAEQIDEPVIFLRGGFEPGCFAEVIAEIEASAVDADAVDAVKAVQRNNAVL